MSIVEIKSIMRRHIEGYFPIRRAQLEYPTEDVSFIYLFAIGKAWVARWGGNYALNTNDYFPDKAVYDVMGDGGELSLRHYGGDRYYARIYINATTEDFQIWKSVGGTITKLGSEAVDLLSGYLGYVKFSVSGSTLKGYRDDMTTPKITVTDTSLTNGRVSVLICRTSSCTSGFGARLLAPSSPSSRPIAYFEVPIIGSGTEEDPYRAQLPEEIVLDWSLDPRLRRKYNILKAKGFTDEEIFELFPEFNTVRVNRLAFSNSILIKTGADGKPIEYRGILRVFEQPDRPSHLRDITTCLDRLANIPGVRKLDKEEAVGEAKRLDDKLHELDLQSARKLGKDRRQAAKEYKDWRVSSLGVKEELVEDEIQERYVDEDKGW